MEKKELLEHPDSTPRHRGQDLKPALAMQKSFPHRWPNAHPSVRRCRFRQVCPHTLPNAVKDE